MATPSPAPDVTVADPVRQALETGISLQQSGRLGEAEAIYRKILLAEPRQADALHLLGLLAREAGKLDIAVALIKQAVDIDSRNAGYCNSMGISCHDGGDVAGAIPWYTRALDLDPTSVIAHYNMAGSLRDLGQTDRAIDHYRHAISLGPGLILARINLGNLLVRLGRLDEALGCYDQAVAIQPASVEAWANRGNILDALQRWEEALASYDQALSLRPDCVPALRGRGNALRGLGRHHEVLINCDRMDAIGAIDADALDRRGCAFAALGRHIEAVQAFRRSLSLAPDRAGVLNNLAGSLIGLYQFDEALATCDHLLQLQPDHPAGLSNRGNLLKALRRYEEAAQCFAKLLQIAPDCPYTLGNLARSRAFSCDWTDYQLLVSSLRSGIRRGARVDNPFSFLSVSDSAEEQRLCASLFIEDKHPAQPALWAGPSRQHDRLRVAYLSADFQNHPCMHLMAGLFEAHDRSRFEFTALSLGPHSDDPMRHRVRRSFERFIEVHQNSDREVAQMLLDLQIDIAVDLNGFTQGGRLGIFAHRAAPLQVSYLGYPGTLGADFMDYLLADAQVVPAWERAHYSEKIAWLPGCYQVNDSARRVGTQSVSREDADLPALSFVFCCFNNNYKITPPIFEIWMRLLQGVPGSVLWLLQDNEAASRNLRLQASRHGVDPRRLVFAARVGTEQHLARHRLADLFLDTLPYNAHTTASDALRVGLPLLTCRGSAFAGRVAASLLGAMGMDDLIAESLEEYERMALTLARSPERLQALRTRLVRARDASALFDTERFARRIESAYSFMWDRHTRGLPPEDFQVPDINA